jgi:hypothetical protein
LIDIGPEEGSLSREVRGWVLFWFGSPSCTEFASVEPAQREGSETAAWDLARLGAVAQARKTTTTRGRARRHLKKEVSIGLFNFSFAFSCGQKWRSRQIENFCDRDASGPELRSSHSPRNEASAAVGLSAYSRAEWVELWMIRGSAPTMRHRIPQQGRVRC